MSYIGIPFEDEKYKNGPQVIPGRVMCAYYDMGGEGVAYHDVDGINHGSGELNPINGSYLHSFRINEGVSTSYTKFFDDIDNNIYNYVEPEENTLYVGWTKPGNWTRYTVDVKNTGIYTISLLYTSRYGGKISLDIDGQDETDPIAVSSTYIEDDPLEWRQWHHWNIAEIAKTKLTEGVHVLTLHTLETGEMNYCFLDFSLVQ